MIYVVEDDKSIRELVAYAMDSAGFEITCCNSAQEFYSALDPSRSQLVILDIMLPGETGWRYSAACAQGRRRRRSR